MRSDFPWSACRGTYSCSSSVQRWRVCSSERSTATSGLGATEPGHGIADWKAMLMELVLTVGLVSTILGTASRAQNVGGLSAIAVGGYIVLAGLWSSPISGAR